ncbi:hypothetical protein [Campylobacter hominis]|uniref:hypothetical protein n=1 Tax=Campylobacter hominis TaxID=76517 RepID=UPI0003012B91|nr:hypothetical protein [Campylobacter hominis]UAK86628.1 hypothetical protein K8O82_07240 [Campylobacter hominis]SUW85673.1 Uncharacterised protein [Campylobacter hominis]
MALKDDIEGIKEQIGTEEQFLQSMIKSELFIKKYKKPLLACVILAVLGFASYYGNEFYKEYKINKANVIFSELVKNPNDEKILNELKNEDFNLYAIYKLENLKNSQNVDMSEIVNDKKLDPMLKNIINLQLGKSGGELLSDYETLLKGFKLLKEGKLKDAKNEFDKIPFNSPLNQIAQNLKHYNITDKK